MTQRKDERPLDEYELMQRWATVSDLADLYAMSQTAVRTRIKTGEWPCHRMGRTIRFSPEDQRDIRDMWKSNQPDLPTRKQNALRRERIKRLLNDVV
ncbi:hypothetical protein [Nesterenkonia alba]|uniref:hypothetical protein n=1 Tax=Nesterenkonia alba TaxID=515814 RepID=UPI0012EBB6E1|nr:hypothetical protein [Nesterenkonia alba]